MNRCLIFLSGAVALLASGCTMAPEYSRPEAPVPAAWPTGGVYKDSAASDGAPLAIDCGWREFFTDERLVSLIDTALHRNRDLLLAALNVERARAMYGITKGELYPALYAGAGGSKQRMPGGVTGFGRSLTIERYDVNLGVASWEIDFFGRIRSLQDAALQEYLGTEQARRGAQIVLIAELAGVYLTLAADRENLELAQSTLETQTSLYNLIKRRVQSGLATELALRQAQTRVDAARVECALYSRAVAEDKNALDLLAGASVPEELLPASLSLVSAPREIAAGTSSEVLLLRPDVLQAESRLKAANANIGAARAAFFPRISLTAALGTASGDLSGLFKSGSEAWNYGADLAMPIFDARTWAALDATKVEQEIAVAQYEKAIQSAFREVADALAVRGTVQDQLSAQESLVEAVGETHRLSNTRYTKGVDSLLVVLDAQSSLYAARQGLVAIRLAKAANQVRLYSVLGGGGDGPAEKRQAAPSATAGQAKPDSSA